MELNHTIVCCRDKTRSSAFMTEILGLAPAVSVYNFMVVTLENGVSLDFMEQEDEIAEQHYAFLVSDKEFDSAFSIIQQQGVDHWADPARTKPGKINTHDGGRGVYFADLDGHLLEIITQPYGSATE
tara:strand:+ start:297 stop:677 length:381 start_codon:yes stop_codon:yes gene_type:complete